jgi:hypothetical protein
MSLEEKKNNKNKNKKKKNKKKKKRTKLCRNLEKTAFMSAWNVDGALVRLNSIPRNL